MFNRYPYTDAHELNLDFCLIKLKELNERVTVLKETITKEAAEIAYEKCKEYINEQIIDIINEFNDLQESFNTLQSGFDYLSGQFSDLAGEFNDLSDEVKTDIAYIKNYVDAQIAGVNVRTDAAIAANNDYLLNTMSTYLANIKVLNYFTGEYISIQDMFDYLARLHTTNALDYDTMASRAKTYNYLAGLNMTYTDLALNGGNLYV